MSNKPKICFLFGSNEYKDQYYSQLVRVFEALRLQNCKFGEGPDLVITNYIDFIKYEEAIKKEVDLSKVVVLSQEKDIVNIENLLIKHGVKHLVAVEKNRAQANLVVSIAGKIISPPEGRLQFDIGRNIKVHKRLIETPNSINPMTEKLIDAVDTTNSFKGTDEIIRMIANELAANGVLHAPVDEMNRPKYSNEGRTASFTLEDREKVSLGFYSDAKKIGVYVKDNFGRLTYDQVLNHVYKCMKNMKKTEETEEGFGAGLFYVYKHTNRFIVNSSPGRMTECIMIIDREKRLKTYRNRQTTFSFYEFK